MNESTVTQPSLQETIGVDLGDRESRYCILDASGTVLVERRVPTTKKALAQFAAERKPSLVAIEAGTHSAWVSRIFAKAGHSVLVANPRKLRIIYDTQRKNDAEDAELLARVARLDPSLLSPIRHRDAAAQSDLALLRSRDALVSARTKLINHVRGAVKSHGERLPACSTGAFGKRVAEELPAELGVALTPVVGQIQSLTERIRELDRVVSDVALNKYPHAARLATVPGVGSLTGLAFVLTIEDPARFPRSRSVAAYLGLVPRQDDSGKSTPQLRITKAGDSMVRKLLVGSAHYTIGPFGPDSDLRRWGLALAERGGKNAKKRAVIAVARKLAVVLLHLWKTGQEFKPFRGDSPTMAEAAVPPTAVAACAPDASGPRNADPPGAARSIPTPCGGLAKSLGGDEATPAAISTASVGNSCKKRTPVEYVLRAGAPATRRAERTRTAAPSRPAPVDGHAANAVREGATPVLDRTGLARDTMPTKSDRSADSTVGFGVAHIPRPASGSSPATPSPEPAVPAPPTTARRAHAGRAYPKRRQGAQVVAIPEDAGGAQATRGAERMDSPVDRRRAETSGIEEPSSTAMPPGNRASAAPSAPTPQVAGCDGAMVSGNQTWVSPRSSAVGIAPVGSDQVSRMLPIDSARGTPRRRAGASASAGATAEAAASRAPRCAGTPASGSPHDRYRSMASPSGMGNV